MDQDVPKDSNMECTCLSLALDKAKNLLAQKGLRLPEFVSIKYDNTGREWKTSSSPSGCHGASTVALFGKCRMGVATLGTPMTLRTKYSQSFQQGKRNAGCCRAPMTSWSQSARPSSRSGGAPCSRTPCLGRGTGYGSLRI